MMTQAAFARLCQISPVMVTKYAAGGYIVRKGKGVDAGASLERLEGHLDETKRRAATERLDAEEALKRGDAPELSLSAATMESEESPALAKETPLYIANLTERQARAGITQLDLLERQQLLTDPVEVNRAIRNAVAQYWSELEFGLRQEADEMSAELKHNADQARQFRAILFRRNRSLRERFAKSLRGMMRGADHSQVADVA